MDRWREPEGPGIWFGLMEGKCVMARLDGPLSERREGRWFAPHSMEQP